MAYATKNTLYSIFGTRNIQIWADLDNDENPNTIASRISWALEYAEELVNSNLVNGHYDAPFTSVPKLITLMTGIQAGLLLFDSRMVTSDGRDPVSMQRKQLKMFFRQIANGQLRLLDPLSGEQLETNASQAPSVETWVDDDEE